jgi:acyl transferase domain-containing protein
MTDGNRDHGEDFVMQQSLGVLWTHGVQPAWEKFHMDERRLRVSLPCYPFERKRFWFSDSFTTNEEKHYGNAK